MNISNNKIWFLFTLLLGSCVTVIALSNIILHPASTMMSGGDSGKNYFTYLYHVVYDRGVWFPGMNYPYGEHITFLDGQPALSIPLSYLRQWIPIDTDAALAIMHLLLGLSYVLAILFVFKTLQYFKVTNWIASLFSILIIIFSPQLFRLPGGHFGLAYTCFIPMLFYWLVRYHDGPRIKYTIYIFIVGTIAAFLHLYFLGMFFFLLCSYCLGYWLFTKTNYKAKFRHIVPLLITAICIAVVVQGFMKLTDPAKDRPIYPWGVLSYCTMGEQIFTSEYSPIWQFIHDKTSVGISDGGEGYIYPGLVVLAVIIISFITGIIYVRRKRKDQLIINTTNFSRVWLFIALSMLLLGMGVPFVWGMEWLLDYVSVFRQFRSLGRFSWAFYYIMTVYAVVVINQWYITRQARGRKTVAYLIPVLCLLVWSFEATGYIHTSRKTADYGRYWYKTYFSKEEKDWKTFLQEHNMKAGDYQAILALPFFNMGTEKLHTDNERSGWVAMLSGKAALQLHLPMVELEGSRGSWSRAFAQMHTAGGPFTIKPLFNDIPDKPLLLLCFEEDTLDNDSRTLVQAADYIGHYSQMDVYTFYPGKLKANDKKSREYSMQIANNMHTTDTCIGCETEYFIEHYDNAHATQKLFGSGALSSNTVEDSLLKIYAIAPADSNKFYELSAWTLLNANDNRLPHFLLEFADSAGNIFYSRYVPSTKCNDNIGMWFRCSHYFKMPANCRKILIHMHNEPVTSYIALDELMLRPADGLVISKFTNGQVTANNHALQQ